MQSNPEEVLESLFATLYNSIRQAAEPVAELDEEWSLHEIAKRIAKYFMKAAQATELFLMRWDEATKQYVEHAMQSYSAACGDKLWFFDLDLASALSVGIWEILKASGAQPRGGFPEVERLATKRYEELMDATLLDKAMFDSTSAVFGDGPTTNKVYKCVLVGHQAAYNEACADRGSLQDLKRVEAFLHEWMEQSMTRAWQAIDGSERLLSVDSVVRLFQNLVAPFGEDHPFSCVPAALTRSIGRPPRTWGFLRQSARQLYEATWGRAAAVAAERAAPASARQPLTC